MTRTTVTAAIAGAIALAVFGLAFLVAPRACEGGLELYFWSGLFSLVVLAALPFAARPASSNLQRAGWAFGCVILGSAAWLAGLFSANVRIICRLF